MNHVRQNFLSSWTIFCPFTLLTSQKIKILKKWKKHLEILSFYTCAPEVHQKWKSYDVWFLRYGVQQAEFLSFLGHFLPFTPLTIWKIKISTKKKDTWIYNHFTRVFHKWKSYVWFLRCVVQQTTFLGILGHFLAFYPTNNPKNKIWKNEEKCLETLSFYTCVLQMMIMWEIIFCHFGPFFALLPH